MPSSVPAADGNELHGYWQWRDALLRHPDGRALGGEPCVKCALPVPPNAHWTHRDRHVCGHRCNSILGRQLNRLIRKGGDLPIPRPEAMPDPRLDPASRVFGTLPVPAATGLHYEFDGFSPRSGDAVERHGEVTVYGWIRAEELPRVPEYAPYGFFVAEHSSGHHLLQAATRDGRPERMLLGEFDPTGGERHGPFEVGGRLLEWVTEFIRDVTPDGREYTWEAPVCVPVAAGHPRLLWTAARTALSDKRQRTSSATARHSRRVRVEKATVERFDPVEVFERDGWLCRLCEQHVDHELRWPDPAAASLDHIVPLVAGGAHSRANTQLAHWLCNVRKGART